MSDGTMICRSCLKDPDAVIPLTDASGPVSDLSNTPNQALSGEDENLFRGLIHTPFTMIFALVLVLVYLAGSYPQFGQPTETFLQWSNLDFTGVITRQEYWRLVTANFSHASWEHLFFNTFALLIFGYLLESLIGWRVMVLWGLTAMVGSDWLTLYFQVPHSVGASGILYGFQTAYIILSARAALVYRSQSFGKTLQSLIGYILVMVVLNISSPYPLNLFGHLGGALAGVLCALTYPFGKRIGSPQPIITALMNLATAGLVLGIFLRHH